MALSSTHDEELLNGLHVEKSDDILCRNIFIIIIIIIIYLQVDVKCRRRRRRRHKDIFSNFCKKNKNMQVTEVAFLTTLISALSANIKQVYTCQSSFKYCDTVTVHGMSW